VRVHSVVGRFLEHSRIFYFENGGDPEYYVGSADWMTRNLDNRVEAVAPVEDPEIREQLRFNLELVLADNRRRWEMHADGTYTQHTPDGDEPVVDTQAVLMDRTRAAVEREGWSMGIVPEHPAVGRELLVEPVDGPARPTDGDAGDGDTADGGTDSGDATAEGTAVREATDGEDGEDGTIRSRDDGGPVPPGDDGESTPGTDGDGASAESHLPDLDGVGDGNGDLPPAFRSHPDRWYVPDSTRYEFAVRTPDGGRRYYESTRGAAAALEEFYG
jgi:polyphosphate kinase